MNFPTKAYILKKLKSGLTTVLTLIGLIAFFVWFDQISEFTLVSFKHLATISFLVTLVPVFILYKKGWGDFFTTQIQLSLIGFLLTMFLSSVVILSINYLTAFGELKEDVYAILAITEKTTNGGREEHYYVKILYHKKELWIISPIDDSSVEDQTAIALLTRKGILGWEVIKEAQLIP